MDNPIVVKLYGGLGNQLFQYAAGKYLSNKFKERLLLDISWFAYNKYSTRRKLDILEYPINFSESYTSSSIIFYSKLLLKKIKKIKTNTSKYNLDLYTSPKHIVLDGYWQDINIVNSIRKELLNEIRYPGKIKSKFYKKVKQSIDHSSSVSLHVRRGDLTLKESATLSCNYYTEAIKIIQRIFPNPKFYIFSDDLNWCKENLNINHELFFVNSGSPTMDIDLMSKCKANILANSTFSWWGAWLNQNDNKKIIAPKEWFQRDVNRNLIDNDWILI